jgi:hypothetical protein
MPGIDDLVDGLAGGSDIDALVDGLAGDSPAPEAQMTVGEPEVIKAQPDASGQALERGLGSSAVSRAKPWYEHLLEPNTRGGLLRRADQAVGQGLANGQLTEDSAAEVARLEQQKASALKHLTDMGSASGMTKKVSAQLAGPFMGAGGASIPANMVNAGIQQTLQSAAEDDDRTALENLESGGTAALTSGALMKGGELAARAGKALLHSANKLRPRVFMSPGQISTYEAAHPEKDALAKLGARAREAGLFKGGIGPATARRVESNAEKLLATSGPSMGRFEDDLVKSGVNPDVDVRPIGENLRAGADYLDKRATAATPAQAEAFRREAAMVQPMETRKMFRPEGLEGEQMSLPGVPDAPPVPPPAPPMPAEQVPLDFESNQMSLPLDAPRPAPPAPPAASPAPAPAPPAPVQAELPGVPAAEVPEPFTTYEAERTYRPFSEAIADKRALQDQVKWNKSAMQDSMGGEAARKASWVGHAQQIDAALDSAAARGEITPEALAGYRKDMQNFSTAATVHEPAMRMANRQGEIGLGAADMLAGAAAGDPGMALASRAGRGRGAASGAAIMEAASATSSAAGSAMTAAGRVIPAIGQAVQNNPPGTPKSDIEREANADTKAQLKGWWQHLTGR